LVTGKIIYQQKQAGETGSEDFITTNADARITQTNTENAPVISAISGHFRNIILFARPLYQTFPIKIHV